MENNKDILHSNCQNGSCWSHGSNNQSATTLTIHPKDQDGHGDQNTDAITSTIADQFSNQRLTELCQDSSQIGSPTNSEPTSFTPTTNSSTLSNISEYLFVDLPLYVAISPSSLRTDVSSPSLPQAEFGPPSSSKSELRTDVHTTMTHSSHPMTTRLKAKQLANQQMKTFLASENGSESQLVNKAEAEPTSWRDAINKEVWK